MNETFKQYLFNKNVLVATATSSEAVSSDEAFATLVGLGYVFGIKIRKGKELATKDLVESAGKFLAIKVPEPFYRGFPNSVRELSFDQLLFDQLIHYVETYGLGRFDEPGHSLLENRFERLAFAEDFTPKIFDIFTEGEALKEIEDSVKALLASTRPISPAQYELVTTYYKEYHNLPAAIANKDLVIKMMYVHEDLYFSKSLRLPDLYNVVDYINYTKYGRKNPKKLNLQNVDRKFVTAVLDRLLSQAGQHFDTYEAECYEKRKFWVGLLHHIHYKPRSEQATRFVSDLRDPKVKNKSVYSMTEGLIKGGEFPSGAAQILKARKGNGALLRNLNYYISRSDETAIKKILSMIDAKNPIVLLQLLYSYATPENSNGRTFVFSKYNTIRVHSETVDEQVNRKSRLTESKRRMVANVLLHKLYEAYENTIPGRIYVDPAFRNIAIPINESTSNGGYGILPKGSVIPLPENKIIRAFTYWEKVNDIDLSVIGLRDDGQIEEFSWRTMFRRQSDEIVYSGDETSGFAGGSEYFDVNLEVFAEKHPWIRHLIFCNNVYSHKQFNECVCRAGYMLRDEISSGEIYEPKTVKTSFTVNAPSTFAYLFAIDLKGKKLIWLNLNREGEHHIAGNTDGSFLTRYFHLADVFNLADLVRASAETMVASPEEANVIFSDKYVGDDSDHVIHSWDIDKILAIVNKKGVL